MRNIGQRIFSRLQIRSAKIQRITHESDANCIWELRMDRNAFATLCEILKTHGGLLDDGNVTLEEQIATFINILAHHTKNISIQTQGGDGLRRYMDVDPKEYTPVTLDELPIRDDVPNKFESVDVVEASDEWSQWRDDLVEEMFDSWMSRRI
ncbi:hypothetical protein Ddye_000735 [Dipteronia dyeriana]|uniref:DUF8040 domain-containing protein n=1 Tax=Dipteronia dyeriana TaxID=168575 RepID=A0AAD9XM85_9ROSI|nr:hypothetical protein Ddye_000735 [Dipteronia dyeriana]